MKCAGRVVGLVAVAVLAEVAGAQVPVLVVDDDGGPGVHHTELQAAVAAAAAGTMILVKDGTYAGVSIDGKGLMIVAELGHAPLVDGAIEISGLPAGATVAIHGLGSGPTAPSQFLRVRDNDGIVWMEDCVLHAEGQPFLGLPHGAVVERSQTVHFVRCSLRGTPEDELGQGGAGLHCIESNIHMFDCVATGGGGLISNDNSPGFAGGAGVEIESGSLYASGSTLQGGPGGHGGTGMTPHFPPCTDSGDGGDGLLLGSGSPSVELLDTQTVGGPAGIAVNGCTQGQPGSPISIDTGNVSVRTEAARSLDATSPVRSGASTTLSFSGQPLDFAWLLVAGAPGASSPPPLAGILAVDPQAFVLFVGSLDGNGQRMLGAPVQLGASLSGLAVYLQGFFLGFSPWEVVLGAPAQLALLGAGT